MSTTSEKIRFPGSQGHELAARLERPESAPLAYALFAHCFTCGKDVFAAQRIAQALASQGIAVLRFDFTGLGHSEGEFANTDFSSNVEDLVAAADYLRTNHKAPQLLIGHSLGGAAVIAAAGEVAEAKAVATIGAPADPGHLSHLFSESASEIEEKGEAQVNLAGRTFRIRREFLEDIAEQTLEEKLRNLRKALMVFHAPRDEVVGIDNASSIFINAKHPKSFVSLDDADHLLTRRADASYVAQVLAAWAGRYLDLEAAKESAQRSWPEPVEGGVVVQETTQGRFTNAVTAGNHRLMADEPKSSGGLDTGPSPYDYLLAGLGACSAMTLRLYAEHKKLPLEGVRVELSHRRVHANDCAECETKEGRLEVIDRSLSISGDLSEEQRNRLVQIADKCPVHRTLAGAVEIHTQLADSTED